MTLAERQHWEGATHEHAVERFYSHGVERYGDFHGGYLNFGLWEEGIPGYVAAAENLVRTLAHSLGLRPGDELLDVACGMGPQDIFLFREFGPLEIEGVDVTWEHVQYGNRRAAQQGCQEQVRFRHGSAVELPFPDASFDHVLCVEGGVHFDTRERFLREAWRVLRPGGAIALADYIITRPPRKLWQRAAVGVTRSLWKIPRQNVLTREGFAQSLERCGFAGVSVRQVGALTYPGYFFEQRRCLAEMRRIRGFFAGYLGHLVDIVAYQAFRRGLVQYVLVRGEKPGTA